MGSDPNHLRPSRDDAPEMESMWPTPLGDADRNLIDSSPEDVNKHILYKLFKYHHG